MQVEVRYTYNRGEGVTPDFSSDTLKHHSKSAFVDTVKGAMLVCTDKRQSDDDVHLHCHVFVGPKVRQFSGFFTPAQIRNIAESMGAAHNVLSVDGGYLSDDQRARLQKAGYLDSPKSDNPQTGNAANAAPTGQAAKT